jgi:predicted Fe-S protein YdhL (DUF1289 family)
MSADLPSPPRRTLPSPCVAVCKLDAETGHCLGCWRTIDEIRRWGVMEDDERLALLATLRQRRREAGDTRDDRRRVNRRRGMEVIP